MPSSAIVPITTFIRGMVVDGMHCHSHGPATGKTLVRQGKPVGAAISSGYRAIRCFASISAAEGRLDWLPVRVHAMDAAAAAR